MITPKRVRDGDSHGLGMSHAMTASQKLSVGATRRVDVAAFGRGNAGWTASNSKHPCPCQNCSQGLPAEKTGRRYLLNRPSCPSQRPNRTQRGNHLNIDRTDQRFPSVILFHKTVRSVPSVTDDMVITLYGKSPFSLPPPSPTPASTPANPSKERESSFFFCFFLLSSSSSFCFFLLGFLVCVFFGFFFGFFCS